MLSKTLKSYTSTVLDGIRSPKLGLFITLCRDPRLTVSSESQASIFSIINRQW